MMTLRDYQVLAKDYVVKRLLAQEPYTLLASPTGTGKSVMEIATLEELRALGHNPVLVTPRQEIIDGICDKLGVVSEVAHRYGIWTPIKLRNRLLAGELMPITELILDEGHHDSAQSWRDLHLLCGCVPAVAFTATPYRGTPRGTAEFKAVWGEPVWAITWDEAVRHGYLSFPTCETIAFLDDDEIEVKNGELATGAISEATLPRLAEIAKLAEQWRGWDCPTLFACPSLVCAYQLQVELTRLDLPSIVVDGSTPYETRRGAFKATVACEVALIHVDVVSEGVDLPLRRLVDLKPTMSPVKWLQQVGRITRPGGKPQYICTNRNLMRHGYLLDGLVPEAAYKQAEAAFGGPGVRGASRVLGLEVLGRLRGGELKLANGMTGLCYAITAMEGHKRRDYFVAFRPDRAEGLWATRTRGDGTYGRWARCVAPTEVSGFASIPAKALSEKQLAWWKRQARRCGLDPTVEPTQRSFQALPVLVDLRARL